MAQAFRIVESIVEVNRADISVSSASQILCILESPCVSTDTPLVRINSTGILVGIESNPVSQ